MNQKIHLVLAIALLTSCGKTEKTPSPFGEITNPQQGTEQTEANFKGGCARRNGKLLKDNTICFYVPHYLELDKAELEKDFKEPGTAFRTYRVGAAQEGSLVWGNATKDAGTVIFYSKTEKKGEVSKGQFPLTVFSAGEVSVMVFKGKYEEVNAYVAHCYTRTQTSIPCPIL
jgi:hypothetical protein